MTDHYICWQCKKTIEQDDEGRLHYGLYLTNPTGETIGICEACFPAEVRTKLTVPAQA